MNKVIDKGVRSCCFVSTIVKHPVLGKNLLVSRVWKKIFPFRKFDHAHENTYWRKTLLLPGVWKTIFHCQ